jgi:molecular chaperone GrpE
MTDESKKDKKAKVNESRENAQDDLAAKIQEASKKDKEAKEAEVKKDEAQVKIEELTASLQRCMADMQNYKRRAEEDKMRFVKFANGELLRMLLPIIDNFDRACQHLPENLKEDVWAKGVVHTHDELMKAVTKIGVKRIETVGKKLDPSKHEAVLAGPGEKDVITEEFEPGYSYHEETLKPAKVKVGNGEKI